MVRLEQTEARISRLRQLVKSAASAPAPQAAPDRSTEIATLTAEVARLMGELADSVAKNTSLEVRLHAAEEALSATLKSKDPDALENAISDADEEIRKADGQPEKDNVDLKWGNIQLKNRVDTLTGENDRLKAQLEAVSAASNAPTDLLTQIGDLTALNLALTEKLAKAAAPSTPASPADPGIITAEDKVLEAQADQIRDLTQRLQEALKFADEIDALAGAAVHKLLANIQSKLPYYAEMQAAHDQRRAKDSMLPPFDLFEAVMSDSDIDPNLREPLREILARGKESPILEL